MCILVAEPAGAFAIKGGFLGTELSLYILFISITPG